MDNLTNSEKKILGDVLVINGLVPIIWNGEDRLITVREYLGVREGWLSLRDLLG